MGNNWAIVVGISQYAHMECLPYAKQDAEAVRDYIEQSAGIEKVYTFLDDSSDLTLDEGVTIPAHPTIANLKRFLQIRFATPFLQPTDTLWFFFHGHGLHHANRDYLMPKDADPLAIEKSAIPVDVLVDYLKQSGTNQIVLVLDACRTKETQFGQGFGTDPGGVITLFSSDYNQTSQSIENLKQGAFTYSLLTALKLLSKYPNTHLEHLHLYLSDALPKLTHQYGKSPQKTRLSATAPFTPDSIALPRLVVRKKLLERILPQWQQELDIKQLGAGSSPDQSIAGSLVAVGMAGVVIAVAGGAAYVLYQGTPDRKATVASQTQEVSSRRNSQSASSTNSKKATPTPAPTVAIGSSTQVAVTDDQLGDGVLRRVPKTGSYFASNTELSNSRREIGKLGDRFCIKVVNGSLSAPLGYKPKVLVSSLSRQQNSVYVDATGERLQPDETFTEFTDGKSIWQWLRGGVDRTGLMAECLAARGKYARQTAPEE